MLGYGLGGAFVVLDLLQPELFGASHVALVAAGCP